MSTAQMCTRYELQKSPFIPWYRLSDIGLIIPIPAAHRMYANPSLNGGQTQILITLQTLLCFQTTELRGLYAQSWDIVEH